ncbi:unnamed protein product [Colletotrichum noveboracense]|uniref:Secreted protein n=1 Tax=Colletotrichum noveboracense TaxID=2664923 RepID=A0A9W4RXS3_9PEZI|nr:unnamed protein product [Colletotrichum noveboracense]
MKLLSLALFAPLVSAVCSTDQVSLTFMRSTFGEPYEEHEVCPAAGSCVNMQSGPDGWAQKANWVILKGNSCVRFYNEYNCPNSAKTWEPACQSVDWSSYILQDWQSGVMKSYTVWKQ